MDRTRICERFRKQRDSPTYYFSFRNINRLCKEMDNKIDGLTTATVKKILMAHFKNPKTKIQPKALEQLTKVLNIAIVECSLRAGKQAFAEDSTIVNVDIVKKILPQMIMDV